MSSFANYKMKKRFGKRQRIASMFPSVAIGSYENKSLRWSILYQNDYAKGVRLVYNDGAEDRINQE